MKFKNKILNEKKIMLNLNMLTNVKSTEIDKD